MITTISEEWRPVTIAGFESSYEVSNFGRVRSVDRLRKGNFGFCRCDGKILRPRINKLGYQQISLWGDAKGKTIHVHRLVALAFVPNPRGQPFVNHIDGDKANCAASNLEWTDDRGNKQHAINTGLITGFKKLLTSDEVGEIRRIGASLRQREIAEMFGTTQTNVSLILRRNRHGS